MMEPNSRPVAAGGAVRSSDVRPLVGVPGQTLQAIDGIPAALPHSWVMNRRYFDALAATGAVPVQVPLFVEERATLRSIFERLDGLFLAGGIDMDPATYGEPLHPLTGRLDPARDAVELELARWALAEGVPVFGVCRGMQVLNVARGGALVQDTTALFPGAIKHDYYPTAGYARDHLAHEVRIEPDSRLGRAFGVERALVNSMHHQGVLRLGAGLLATAWAPDGLIEAIECRASAFAVGVQWHPEMLIDRDAATRRLFEAFTAEAAAYAEQRAYVRPVGA
jgi:putative glutamine amidotransferase